MSKKNTTKTKLVNCNLKKYWHVYVTILLVASVGITLAWINRNQINPDGVSYIQVARHYAAFDIKTAVNGYWAPLLSWLIVPFVWLRIDPLFGFRIINFGISILIVCSLLFLLNRNHVTSTAEKIAQIAYLASFGILLNEWGSSVVTPDLLSGAILMVVILAIYQHTKKNNTKWAIFLGLCFSMLYFAKSVGLYISIILIILICIYEIYYTKKVSKYSIVAALVFVVVSSAWICLISIKYDKLTISTAGSYNFSLIGPTHPVQPQLVEGYLPTKHVGDVWAWDDPSYYSVPSWKISDNAPYYANHVLATMNQALSLLFTSSWLVIFGIFAIFKRKRNENINIAGYALAVASFTVIGAYSLVLVEPRYLWFISTPIIAFGATLLLKKSRHIPSFDAVYLIIFVASLLSIVPLFQDGHQAQLLQGGTKYLSQKSTNNIPQSSTIAGREPNVYKYCYFSKTRCVGFFALNGDTSHDEHLIREMRSHGIEYYVEFSKTRLPYLNKVYDETDSSHQCTDYTTGKSITCEQAHLSIYKL